MAGCPVTCLHRQHVEGYRLQRESELAAQEAATYGYKTEMSTYPVLTFHDYLVRTAGWSGARDE